MDMDTDLLPEDAAAQAAAEETPEPGDQDEGSEAPAFSESQMAYIGTLLNQQADALSRKFQSHLDKTTARMERKMRGDPGQAALKVARDHGLQIPADQEQKYLESLRTSGALAADPDDDQAAEPQGQPDDETARIQATGGRLFQSLGLSRSDPEAAALFSGRGYASEAEYYKAIYQAAAQKAQRGAGGQKNGQTGQRRQPAPPALLPSGGHQRAPKDNPSLDDVVGEEFDRIHRRR